jgi:hypothetical protein
MSATPGARNEYSRGSQGSSGDSGHSDEPRRGASRPRRGASRGLAPGAVGLVLAGALLGALLLIVAEFTTLYHVRVASGSVLVRSVGTGSNHSYAMIPIALLAVFLALAAGRGGGWVPLVGLGVAGVVALLIALLGDLPDARHTGPIRSPTGGFVQARSTPSAGLYMETLGAVILIATCGSGMLLLRRPGAGSA